MATKPSEDSLFEQHLRIMGLDGGAPVRPEDVPEARFVAGLELKPLDFARVEAASSQPARRAAGRSRQAGLALTALLGIASLFAQSKWGGEDRLTPKGAARAWLFVDSGGKVAEWTPDTKVGAGDRVRIELLAAHDGVAYAGVTDRAGRLITETTSGEAASVRLRSAVRQPYPKSFALDGQNEGEIVVALICTSPVAGGAAGLAGLLRQASAAAGRYGDCESWRFPLR